MISHQGSLISGSIFSYKNVTDNILNRDEIGIEDLVQNLQATGSYDRRRVLQRQNRVIGDQIQDIFVQLEILRLRQHVCEYLHAEILVLHAEIFDVFKQPEPE